MKFYGQFQPPVDQVLYERYFKNKQQGTSIECGALDGVWACCTKIFEEHLNWKTINVEPLPIAFEKLKINRPKSNNLCIALSNVNCHKTFTNYKHPTLGFFWGNGSLSHGAEHKKQLQQQCGAENYEEIKVICMTYKSLIEKLNISELDLFVLDVEGHEFEVIDGMVGANVFPNVFVIEHGHKTPSDIENKLKVLPVEYELDHISFVNSFFVKK